MKKFFKRLLLIIIGLVLVVAGIYFGPNILNRILGGGNTQWISERFSETLREKNELVVNEIEITGQQTVSQDAWLLGTVQKVEIPYTFHMRFTVDLSKASVSVEGNIITVRVPTPTPNYPKLTVDENEVRKFDWLYPLTTERYAAIKQQMEDELFAEFGANEEYRENAWNATVTHLKGLFNSVVNNSAGGQTCEISIVADDSLTAAATEEPTATP